MPWRGSIWIVMILLPAVLLAGVHKHVKHKYWSDKYDRHFRKNSKHYFGPGFDWHWFKAQGIAESGLNPKAKSSAGAVGIMQIMPATYGDILKSKPNLGNIEDPRWNIAAAIFYNRQLYKAWKKKNISIDERLNFTFASYNAGFGRMSKAMKKTAKKHIKQPEAATSWDKVSPFTPPQTRHYVRRINKLMQINPVAKKSS
ncbi:MAG: transglycosylase SLT domain-containing protein [Gammaproteobacteria bacterium]|nr:transglycosylase SLT domain-containing protein [Gammaproteobacteria bacterium]